MQSLPWSYSVDTSRRFPICTYLSICTVACSQWKPMKAWGSEANNNCSNCFLDSTAALLRIRLHLPTFPLCESFHIHCTPSSVASFPVSTVTVKLETSHWWRRPDLCTPTVVQMSASEPSIRAAALGEKGRGLKSNPETLISDKWLLACREWPQQQWSSPQHAYNMINPDRL